MERLPTPDIHNELKQLLESNEEFTAQEQLALGILSSVLSEGRGSFEQKGVLIRAEQEVSKKRDLVGRIYDLRDVSNVSELVYNLADCLNDLLTKPTPHSFVRVPAFFVRSRNNSNEYILHLSSTFARPPLLETMMLIGKLEKMPYTMVEIAQELPFDMEIVGYKRQMKHEESTILLRGKNAESQRIYRTKRILQAARLVSTMDTVAYRIPSASGQQTLVTKFDPYKIKPS